MMHGEQILSFIGNFRNAIKEAPLIYLIFKLAFIMLIFENKIDPRYIDWRKH
jgi:hypothetical protein